MVDAKMFLIAEPLLKRVELVKAATSEQSRMEKPASKSATYAIPGTKHLEIVQPATMATSSKMDVAFKNDLHQTTTFINFSAIGNRILNLCKKYGF